MKPGGLRMGTPAMTTRGLLPDDFTRVAEIVDRAVTITQHLSTKAVEESESKSRKNPASVSAFVEYVADGNEIREIVELRSEVEAWIGTFSLPWIKEEH